MEGNTYGGSVSSATVSSNVIQSVGTITSSNNVNHDTRSSSRRHQQKKVHNHEPLTNKDERIEVKILPQDDNWGETTTITCHGGNEDALTNNNDTSLQLNEPTHEMITKVNHRTRTHFIYQYSCYLLYFIALISPVLFTLLPYILNKNELKSTDNYTLLLTICFKLILLFFAILLLTYRRRNTTYLPRLQIQKLIFNLILTILILTYWLYYIFKLLEVTEDQYDKILLMTSSYEDLLLLLLFLMIITLEVKWLYPKWIIKVVRSPDGQTRQYTIGSMSIQEASVYLLEQYYKDFPVFNPWLENAYQTQARQPGAYSTKSVGSQSNASTIGGGTNRNGDNGQSMRGYADRFYDELDYERRVRKRRTKLVSACEDAFTHVRKCFNEKYGSHVSMDAREAAQAVFSSMSRSLQKYLRITRQQPYFTRESIISHLATCLSHDLSPRAFLERYVQIESQPLATLIFPALARSVNYNKEQSWTIICDTQPYVKDKDENKLVSINQTIYSDLVFVLKQQNAEHISLICAVYEIPKINLVEKLFDFKTNKFVLKLNSETSV